MPKRERFAVSQREGDDHKGTPGLLKFERTMQTTTRQHTLAPMMVRSRLSLLRVGAGAVLDGESV